MEMFLGHFYFEFSYFVILVSHFYFIIFNNYYIYQNYQNQVTYHQKYISILKILLHKTKQTLKFITLSDKKIKNSKPHKPHMNNLQIFRTSIDEFLNSQQIISIQKWRELLDHLCNLKIFNPKQIKILNQNVAKRSFPIRVDQFQEIIMKQFGDDATKYLMKDIEQIQKQIRQTKGVLAVWKEQGLSKSQIRALEILFARGNNKMKQICNILQEKKQLLQSISQPQIQMIKAMDQWTIMQKIKQPYKDFQQFQNINGKAIDNLYSQLKVREVYFRTKKISKQEIIQSMSGFNSKTDEQVQVTKIPKKMNDFQTINTALVTYNAQRDLMLSPYFLRFLGYSTNADPNYYFYFREYIQTKNLENLIKNSSVKMQQHFCIFKYWVGQIYRGLRDIFYQSSYQPILPITIKDIQIAEYGLRVIFKHTKFIKSRQPSQNIEPQLLQNLGTIILDLLKITQEQIEHRIKNIQNRSLIYTLLKARQGYKKYQQKIVPCYINFFNVQTHPLLESIQESQGIDVIDNFTILFGDQC